MARSRGWKDRRQSESGDTLIEVLLAIVVLGLASVALLIAFGTSISASANHRNLASFDTLLSTVTQNAISSIQQDTALFSCPATAVTYYPSLSLTGSTFPSASKYTVQYASSNPIEYWNTLTGQFQATCIAGAPQLITITALLRTGDTISNSFVVDYPLAPPITGATGSATGLIFLTSPGPTGSSSTYAAAAGASFTAQPVVEVLGSGGAVTNDYSPVTLSITSGTPSSGGPGTLTGCVGNEILGVVTFTGCTISTAGEAYTLTASDGSLPVGEQTAVSSPLSGFNIGAAGDSLAFAREPAGAASGSALATQPILDVDTPTGTVDTTYTGTITLSTSGGVLSGCSNLTAVAGVVNVSGCTFAGAYTYNPSSGVYIPTPYTMLATANGVISATSTTLEVTGPGPATKLFFSTEPTGVASASSSTPFTGQPAVTAQDSFGNIVTNYAGTITPSMTGGGLLSGCAQTTSSGVVTFTGCHGSAYGDGVTMTATSGSLTATSTAFNITNVATQLLFTTEPAIGVSGSNFSPQPVLTVEDAGNNVVTATTSLLTLTASGGTLQFCTNLSPVLGVYSVQSCTFGGVVGTPYHLVAVSGSLTVNSTNFSPTESGTATQLVFTTQPVAGAAGATMTTQPVVKVEDSAGNVVTTSPSIILTPSGGTFTSCTGLTAVSGVVNASGCVFGGTVGTQYFLTASSGNLTQATSNNFTPSMAGTPADIIITGCATSPLSGASCTLTATIIDAYSNTELSYGSSIVFSSTGTGSMTPLGSQPATAGVATDPAFALNIGSITVSATGDGVTSSAPFTTTILPKPQTINWTAPTTETWVSGGAGTFPTGTATDSASSTVTFASSTPSVCTVVGTTVTMLHAGTCTLTPSATASGNWALTPGTASNITINPANQAALLLTSITDAYGGANLTLTTSGGSDGGAVTYVVTSAGSAGCSLVGGTALTETSTGTCTVTATMAGTTDYNPVSSAATTVTITLGTQAALTLTSTTGTYGSTLALTASGGTTGGALSYVVNTVGTAGCSVTGSTLSNTGAGTCTVTATMAGNSNYNPVSSSATTVTIGQANQAALTLTSTSVNYSSTLTLTATGGSDSGAISYVVTTAGTANCTITGGNVLHNTSGGTCTVTATMAGNANYFPVSSSATTITVNPIAQAALNLTSTTGTYGVALTLTTSGGSSGGAISYVVTTAGTANCSITGITLTETSAGTCTVTATMAATADYNVVSSTATTVTINPASQAALTISSVSGFYGSTLTMTTTGGTTGGTVTYVVNTVGTAGCSVTGAVLSNTAMGTCTVTATMAGNTDYAAVSSSSTTITIGKGNQAALTITSTSGNYNSTLTLTTSGGTTAGAVTYVVNTVGTANCSVVGAVLSYTSGGTCTVTATMAGNTNYNNVSSSATTITVNPINQAALTLSSTSVNYNSTLTLTSSGGSGTGAVSFAVTTVGTANCSITGGNVLHSTSGGTCSVTVTKAASADYNAISSSPTTVTVNPIAQAALTLTSTTDAFGGANLTLTTSGGSTGGTATYVVTSAGSAGCSLVGGTALTETSIGSCTVTATLAANADYTAISSTATTVTITIGTQAALTITSTSGTHGGGTPLTLTVTGGSTGGTVTYSIIGGAGTAGCTLTGGGTTLTATNTGHCNIQATMAGNTNYNAVSSITTQINFS